MKYIQHDPLATGHFLVHTLPDGRESALRSLCGVKTWHHYLSVYIETGKETLFASCITCKECKALYPLEVLSRMDI